MNQLETKQRYCLESVIRYVLCLCVYNKIHPGLVFSEYFLLSALADGYNLLCKVSGQLSHSLFLLTEPY